LDTPPYIFNNYTVHSSLCNVPNSLDSDEQACTAERPRRQFWRYQIRISVGLPVTVPGNFIFSASKYVTDTFF